MKELTFNMLGELRRLQREDDRKSGVSVDMHARTAWALAKRGLLEVDGASDHAHYQNGNYVSVCLTSSGRIFCTGRP